MHLPDHFLPPLASHFQIITIQREMKANDTDVLAVEDLTKSWG